MGIQHRVLPVMNGNLRSVVVAEFVLWMTDAHLAEERLRPDISKRMVAVIRAHVPRSKQMLRTLLAAKKSVEVVLTDWKDDIISSFREDQHAAGYEPWHWHFAVNFSQSFGSDAAKVSEALRILHKKDDSAPRGDVPMKMSTEVRGWMRVWPSAVTDVKRCYKPPCL